MTVDPDLEKLKSVNEEVIDGGGTGNDKEGDLRVQELIDRLKAVEAQLDNQNATPEVTRSVFPDFHPDFHHFPHDNHRVNYHRVSSEEHNHQGL